MANTIAPTGGPTILSHPIFLETILPFVLVFTIVFAILQKAKILGEEKRQIDAIVALVVGLIVISFAQAVRIILPLTVFLAVSLVVLLVLMILLGSFWKGDLPKGVTYSLVVIAAIAVVIATLYLTNAWQYLIDIISIGGDSPIFANVLFVVIIAAAVVAVILGAGKAKE